MDDRPFERVQALDVRPRPATEQAEAGEKDIRGVLKLRRLFILCLPLLDALPIRLDTDSKYPLALIGVPLGAHQPVAELDERPELPVVDDALDVGANLGAGDVEFGPVGLPDDA